MPRVTSLIPHEIVGIKFTHTERSILEVLSDGEPYTVDDLKLYDKLTDDVTTQTHVHNIRKKIVISHFRIHSGTEGGRLVYRLVKLLSIS